MVAMATINFLSHMQLIVPEKKTTHHLLLFSFVQYLGFDIDSLQGIKK
jgi:hypothetical protein